MTIKLVRTSTRPDISVSWLPVSDKLIPWLRSSPHFIEYSEEESLDGLTMVQTFLLGDDAEEMITNNIRTAEQIESLNILDAHNLAHDITNSSTFEKI